MSDIKIAGSVIPSSANTPTDARTRVSTIADILNIEVPAIGMLVYCEEDGITYIIKTLKSKEVNGIPVPNTAVDTYEKFIPELADVATTGSYDDLTNKPTIPSKVSDLTDGTDYAKTSDLANVATSGSYNDLSDKPTLPVELSPTEIITVDNNSYAASYLVSDYHRISISGSCDLVVSNIPVGKFLMIYVDNSAAGSLTFNSQEILLTVDTGKYHIVFGNPAGTIVMIGDPSEALS